MTSRPTTSHADHHRARVGLIYGLAAYFVWGVSPIYFKLVAHVPPVLVVAHRVVWSLVFLAFLVALQHRWAELRDALRSRSVLLTLACTTVLIALNWLTFIWAIANGHVMQASMGYFITPLLSFLFGIVLLRERVRILQLFSLILATIGVAILIIKAGEIPWIAISLAGTFAIYAVLRKTSSVAPLVGSTIETGLLLLPALILIFVGLPDQPQRFDVPTYSLLMLAGVITAIPLLCFTAAAHRLRLTTIGFLQYLAPTCQFLLALVIFKEPFTASHAVTFGFIWTALIIYSMDSLRSLRSAKPAVELPT